MSRNSLNASRRKLKASQKRPAPNNSERFSWLDHLLLGERHAVPWAALGVVVAILGLITGILVPRLIQSHVEELSVSKITYAVSILPNPPPGEFSNSTTYWVSTINLWNTGPAAAKTVVLHINASPSEILLHSPPVLISAPAAAEVQINERIPRGIYEVVIRNFTPGEFCALRMAYHADGELALKIRDEFDNDGLRSAIFAKNFISQFWFSGENLSAENIGMLDVKQTFSPK